MSTAAQPQATSPRKMPRKMPQKSRGELLFDVLLIVAIGSYLYVAQSYPPIGREIPTVVGVVALAAAVVQLIGWFVPGMWNFTHGDATKDHGARPAAVGGVTLDATAVDTTTDATLVETTAPDAAPLDAGASGTAAPQADPRDVPIAMGWAAGFVVAILLIGYTFAVPLFFLAYFSARRAWRLAVVSAVVMGLVTRFLFESLLGIPFPGGVLF